MLHLLAVLAIVFLGYNKGRNKRIQKWGRRRYDGTTPPKF